MNVTSKLSAEKYTIKIEDEISKYQIVPQFSSTLRKQLILESTQPRATHYLESCNYKIAGPFNSDEGNGWDPLGKIMVHKNFKLSLEWKSKRYHRKGSRENIDHRFS